MDAMSHSKSSLIVTHGDSAAMFACCEYLMALSALGQPYGVHYAVDGMIFCLASSHSIAFSAPLREIEVMIGFTDAAAMLATASTPTLLTELFSTTPVQAVLTV